MKDLATGFALALVFEGLLWALAPDLARRMLSEMANMPPKQIERAAWGFVAAGAAIVWLVRG